MIIRCRMDNFRHILSKTVPDALQIMKRSLGRMEKHKVVPDVISALPKHICSVKFEKLSAEMGNILTPKQVKDPPTVTWNCQAGQYYTLCMTDPDAPSRREPKFREWHHWLVVNIDKNKVAYGDVLSEYISSAPPKGTGLHRYVILVYQQPRKMDFKEKKLTKRSADHRGGWSISKFAAKYKLGSPHAGNFFQAEWDDYVPRVYQQLGG